MVDENRMLLTDALSVLASRRTNEVVVSTMSAAREWMRISDSALDLNYIPSTMGGAFSLGLGIAVAQPTRHVIVLNGDGCVLMNLGSLVTVSTCNPGNFTGIIIDNESFETTGGQKLATASNHIDLADFARSARFPTVVEFRDLDSWEAGIDSALAMPGPRCIVLRVKRCDDFTLRSPGPMPERIEKLRSALAGEFDT